MFKNIILVFISSMFLLVVKAQEQQSFSFVSSVTSFTLGNETESIGKITISPTVNGNDQIAEIVKNVGYTIQPNLEYTLTGNFTSLDVKNNYLTSLDVSNLISLENLNCLSNNINTLELAGLTKLKSVVCSFNNLSSLNVLGLTDLETLSCGNNMIKSLKVFDLSSLKIISCSFNSLTSLELSVLDNLEKLSCEFNKLSSLDVSGFANLKYLSCSNNSLGQLNVSGLLNFEFLNCELNQLISLDVSNLPNLKDLYCFANKLIDINMNNTPIPENFNASYQSCWIAMEADNDSGFVSANTYTFFDDHSLSIPEGFTFEQGHFKCAVLPNEEVDFNTSISWEEKTITGKLKFELATLAIISGSKILTGKDLESEQFEFQLLDIFNTIASSAKNAFDGSVSIEIFLPEGEHVFVLNEKDDGLLGYVYDTKEYNVKVIVSLNEQDNILSAEVEIKDDETLVEIAKFENLYANTEVEQLKTDNQIHIYPLPVHDQLNIESSDMIYGIEVYSISGMLLIKDLVKNTHYNLSTSGLCQGMYILRVQTEKGLKSLRLVKE